MRVSFQWLSEIVDLPDGVDVHAVSAKLTLAGLEVEESEDLAAPLSGVVVARIADAQPHPDADKLSVCTVSTGTQTHTVVCGAKNFAVGDTVAFATPGTMLPGGFEIGERSVRGIHSAGMLCSEKELGVSDAHEGIAILDAATAGPLGAPAAAAFGCDDVVLVIGVTPNRPDALSYLGIAREVAALFGTRLKLPAPTCAERGGPIDDVVRVSIDAPELAPRYACRVIEGVQVGPSPAWVVRRLAACGVRSVNNIVDVTNLVMMERGLPLHAFDLDRIGKDRDRAHVVVRTAAAGEQLTTLDDAVRTLEETDVVIADPRGPIALGGVMGGLESEVTSGTQNVLLEAAYFEPSSVRRTAKRLGLHSEASHRFERGCDPNGVLQALDRAASLMIEFAGGQARRGVVDVYPKRIAPVEVSLRPARIAQVSGLPSKEVDEAATSKLLLSIGLEVVGREGEALRFRVPTYRPDLTREIDLIEEVLRLVGYDRVPSTLPGRSVDVSGGPKSHRIRALSVARASLAATGAFEAVNLAFQAPGDVVAYGWPEADHVRVANPLGRERSVMRASLLPGLVANVSRNQRHGAQAVRLFEVGKVFLGLNPNGAVANPRDPAAAAGGDAFAIEASRLAGVFAGEAEPRGYGRTPRALDFYDLKGVVEELLGALGFDVRDGMGDVRFSALNADDDALHPRSATRVEIRDDEAWVDVGALGELHPDLVDRADLRDAPFVFEFDFDALVRLGVQGARAHALPKYQAVKRDLALVVARGIPSAELLRVMARVDTGVVRVDDVAVFDVYTGQGVAEDKQSVALQIVLRADDRTLTDKDISRAMDALTAALQAELSAEVRA